jgi:ABC-type multidrug transport system ATPase subunit
MSAATEYAVEMDGITRRFGEFVAVDHVTLKIPKGHLYGFLGLNGAGKTTTIRVLTTLLPPTAGIGKALGARRCPGPPGGAQARRARE